MDSHSANQQSCPSKRKPSEELGTFPSEEDNDEDETDESKKRCLVTDVSDAKTHDYNNQTPSSSSSSTSTSDANDEHHPIFDIELVMLNILKNLNNIELLNSRQVNSQFKFYSTEILHRRDSHLVTLTYDWKKRQYIKASISNQEKFQEKQNWFTKINEKEEQKNFPLTLSDLTTLLQSSSFPCKTFSFSSGTLKSCDLQNFLSNHGCFIRALQLDVFYPGKKSDDEMKMIEREFVSPSSTIMGEIPNVSLLRNLLLEQCPNLSSLSLSNCPLQWFYTTKGNTLFEKQEKLPNLKCFIGDSSVPKKIYADILEASLNLQEVFPFEKAAVLLDANRFYLFKTLICRPTPYNVESFERILPQTPSQLNHLSFAADGSPNASEMYPRMAHVLENILSASFKTLRSICFKSQIGSLYSLRMPVCPKVTSLTISTSSISFMFNSAQFSKKFFPPGFQITQAFPNVTEIVFDFHSLTRIENWDDFYNEDLEPVTSVRSLVFLKRKYLPLGWFQKFSTLFPEVERITVETVNFNLMDAARSGLWRFEKLKELKCDISVEISQSCYPALDSAFTGFSFKTCELLRMGSKFEHENGQANYESVAPVPLSVCPTTRPFPSIVDAKHLEKLHLTFVDELPVTRVGVSPILTYEVGFQHAFALCPNLNVKIDFHVENHENLSALKNVLRPIFPSVLGI